jgi:hypothetical protein
MVIMATRSNRRSSHLNSSNTEVQADNSTSAEVEGTVENTEVTADEVKASEVEAVPAEEVVQSAENTDKVKKTSKQPEGTVSVYAAARRVNGWLKERGAKKADGTPKELPPQMFYNYTTARIRKGQNPAMAVVTSEDGKHYIEDAVLGEWFEAYYAKNVAAKNTGTATTVDESSENGEAATV